jgi:hypothetical protein
MKSNVFVLLLVSVAVLCNTIVWGDNMKLIPSDSLTKVLRNSISNSSNVSELIMDAASGETISSQAVVIPGDMPDVVSAAVSDFKSIDGKLVIKADSVRLHWVRYIDITKNSPSIPADELIAAAPVSIPDPFWEDGKLAVEPKIPQPIWIDVDVPADAKHGEYRGELKVTSSTGTCSIPVVLRVRNFKLSDTRHQRVIQWWEFPGRGFENIKFGTEEYWKHLEESCKFLYKYRQTDVRAAWALIEHKTLPSGKIVCNPANFEKYMDIVLKSGLHAVQFDALGQHTKSQLEQDSRTIGHDYNLERLAALQKLVKKRGWKGRVFISLADEPFIYCEKTYNELLAKVHKIAPDVGVIEAIENDGIDDIDIFVPKLTHINLWWPYFQELQRQGKEIWFYTCCHPLGRYPNRFLDQPLLTGRELHWIQYLYGLDGFLHWGLNFFAADKDPYSEDTAMGWGLPQGDNAVAYPGKAGYLASMRLSAMRDGLQDYEYLWTLENRLSELKKHVGDDAKWLDPRQRPLELCHRVVQSFYDHTRDPKVLINTRATIADEIEALDANLLLYVQTSPPETTVTPEGPILINVRGIVTPGAKVTINSTPVITENITKTGCFMGCVFLSEKENEVIVTAELNGVTRTCKRVFVVKN